MQIKLVKIILRKELRDILRDRRTIFVMLVLPVLLYPLLLIGFMQLTALQLTRIRAKTSTAALIGRPAAAELSARLDTLQGVAWVDSARWRERIVAGELDAALVIPDGFAEDVRDLRMPRVAVFHNGSRELSRLTGKRIQTVIEDYRNSIVAIRLAALSADTSLLRPFDVVDENIATAEQQQGDLLGKVLGYILIMMTIMGAFYPAVDLTAGEKERGTLETLLVSPAGRVDIVYGKFFAVLVVALLTALLNLLSIGATMAYAMHFISGALSGALPGIAVSPLSLLLSLLLIVPLAVLFAAVCLAIAAGARNYKEGQSLLTPVYTVAILPAMISLVPGTEIGPVLAAVPIVNISLLIKEFMMGNYLWLETAIAFGSTSVLAAGSLGWAVNQFQQESVLFRHAEEVRWSLLRRFTGPRASAFPSAASAAMLVVVAILLLFILNSFVTDLGIVRSLLLTQGLILLLPLFMVYRGGYDFRTVLALRRPPPAAWPAAALIMLGGWVVALELASLQNMVMPFPEQLLRQFTELFAELNALPLVMGVLAIAVVPGVVEELLCRGVLLNSLKSRFGGTGAIVLAAIAFGFLHLDSYRLLPTTFLGLLLGFIAVRTGSVFPAMFAHAMNNALSFMVQRHETAFRGITWLDLESGRSLPWFVLLPALIVLAVGLWRIRKPGTREHSRWPVDKEDSEFIR